MLNGKSIGLGLAFLTIGLVLCGQSTDSVYFTMGFKLGELTDTSVVVQVRLCGAPEPVPIYHEQEDELPFRHPIDFDDTMPVERMDGAVAGAFGQVRIELIPIAELGPSDLPPADTLRTDWLYVSAYRDYTLKRSFTRLRPYTEYRVEIFGKGADKPATPPKTITGYFRTTPDPQLVVPVLFTSSTCQYFWDYDDPERGFQIYDRMRGLKPAFHCQTGDYVYYDKPGPLAKTVELARHKWHAINSWPSLVDFYVRTPLMIQKDDHDVIDDDGTPHSEPYGELTFADGLQVWYEQTPTLPDRPYRRLRYGKDLEIWFVEGREFRNTDNVKGPESSIWGLDQKRWLTETMTASDATFKILMSPTPIVGPDRKNKKDNHANEVYAAEGDWVRSFLADQPNTFIINGDRHWQYVARDAETGVYEFSQGPSSDEHAQGWGENDRRPEHEFLRVKGGFLAVEVDRARKSANIRFRHYDVAGEVVHEKTFATAVE